MNNDNIRIAFELIRNPQLTNISPYKEWLESHENQQLLAAARVSYTKYLENNTQSPDVNQELKRVMGRISRRRILLRVSMATSVAAAILVGALLYFSPLHSGIDDSGAEIAVLNLGRKSLIFLDSAGVQIHNTDTVADSVSASKNVISYKEISKLQESNPTIKKQRIITGERDQYCIELPDSTKVWIMQNSQLTFPLAFSGNMREVELSGQAYFDVTHNADKPFRVVCKDVTTTVLGTEFNISSLFGATKVSLVKGKVVVTENNNLDNVTVLSPGEELTYANDKITVYERDMQEYTAWRDGYFYFDNQSLGQVLATISYWYNVDYCMTAVELMDVRFNMRFTLWLLRESPLTDIINQLNELKIVNVELKNNMLMVTKTQ